MDKLENDKLIAIFMGREVHTDGIGWFDEKFNIIKYNNWNILMPVVDKIGNLQEKEGKFQPRGFINNLTLWTSLEDVYFGVVLYIKWYNDEYSK